VWRFSRGRLWPFAFGGLGAVSGRPWAVATSFSGRLDIKWDINSMLGLIQYLGWKESRFG
jgi:hypothetical protein